jgi:hypothetical protein
MIPASCKKRPACAAEIGRGERDINHRLGQRIHCRLAQHADQEPFTLRRRVLHGHTSRLSCCCGADLRNEGSAHADKSARREQRLPFRLAVAVKLR